MKDNASPFLQKFVEELERLQKSESSVVVAESKHVGAMKDGMSPLSKRLSPTTEAANVRKELEDAKSGEAASDDDSMDEEVVQQWADDIIHKTIERLFGN